MEVIDIKNLNMNNVITGTALTVAAAALIPIMKDTLRPLAVLGIKGVIGVVDGTRTTVQLAKEELEDIVAEAQFERMKKKLDQEINLLPSFESTSHTEVVEGREA